MASINYFQMTKDDLEKTAETVKLVILNDLIKEGFISNDDADKWCSEHCVITRNKSIFKTLSDKWSKIKDDETRYYWLVVKRKNDE